MVVFYYQLDYLQAAESIALLAFSSQLIENLNYVIVVFFKVKNSKVAFIDLFQYSKSLFFDHRVLVLLKTAAYDRKNDSPA